MFEKLTVGQEIESVVLAVNNDTVFIELNPKCDGVIDLDEFKNEDGSCSVKEGDKIKVFFLGEIRGEMRFTTKIKGENADSSILENAFKNHIEVQGSVEEEIKGGFRVKIGTSRAFCPYSQMGSHKKDENETFVGRTLSFFITEYKKDGKDLLVSNRAVLEQKRKEQLENLSQEIAVGAVVEGTVTRLQSFGAFIDVNGFEVLLPIGEISFERVKNASDVLTVGDKVVAKVISADWVRERVSVSVKALQQDPWETIAQKFKAGDKFDGEISKISEFGLFINIDKGIDGLVHKSTLLDVDRNTNLKKKFAIGEKMSVVIKEVNIKDRRISLLPATSVEQDNCASEYLHDQDNGETYNPFAALLKK